jgi:hypothetical protein
MSNFFSVKSYEKWQISVICGSESFYRKIISLGKFGQTLFHQKGWPKTVWKFIWPNWHIPERHLTDKNQEIIISPDLLSTKNFIWPKKKWAKDRLTESSFYRKLFSKKIDRMICSKAGHSTDCSYSIKMICVPNFCVLSSFW